MPTSPYQTLGQIRSAVIADAKQASSAQLVSQINRWVNEGYELVDFRKKRDWLDQTITVQTASAVTSVCTVTQNSNTVTFATSASFVAGIDLIFYTNGFNEVYNVTSTAGHTAQLASPYLGASNTAANGVITQPSFVLDSSIKTVYQVYHQWLTQSLAELGPQQMRETALTFGPDLDYARYASIFGQNSTGQKRMFIYPYPNTAYTFYIDAQVYETPLAADNDEPVMPMKKRQALYHYALYKLYSFHKNDQKASEYLTNYKSVLDSIDGEMKAQMDFPQLSVSYPRGRSPRRLTIGFDRRLRD